MLYFYSFFFGMGSDGGDVMLHLFLLIVFFFDLLCAEMAETLGLDIWICGCMVPLVLD